MFMRVPQIIWRLLFMTEPTIDMCWFPCSHCIFVRASGLQKMALESLVGHAEGHARRNEIDELHDLLHRSTDQCLSNCDLLPRAIGQLMHDVTLNTLSIVYLSGLALLKQSTSSSVLLLTPEAIVKVTESIIKLGDARQLHGRREPLTFYGSLLRQYSTVVADNEASLGRQGLHHLKLALSPTSVSPAHGGFLKVAVKCQNFSAAEHLLRTTDALHFEPSVTGVSHVDVLSFFYYGALTYVGLHRWVDALGFLETCLSVPAIGVSMFVVEAFRLFYLVHVLHRGTLPTKLAGLSSQHERVCRTLSQEYIDICAAIDNKDHETIAAVMASCSKEFAASHLYGVVRLAIQSVKRHTIIDLTRTYLTLTLADISQLVKEPVPLLERRLRLMITSGEINAIIDSATQTVSFGAPPATACSSPMPRRTSPKRRAAPIPTSPPWPPGTTT